MSIGKKTFFCWLLLYGCVTACAAEELVPAMSKEEKFEKLPILSVITQDAQPASYCARRRNSCSSPLSPPPKTIPRPRRLSLSYLENIAWKKPCSLVLDKAQLRNMITSLPHKNGESARLLPVVLGDMQIGDIAYRVESSNLKSSKVYRYINGKILFVPLGITDGKICWMAIMDEKSPIGRTYYATTWFSRSTLPPVRFMWDDECFSDSSDDDSSGDDSPHEPRLCITLNNLPLDEVGSVLSGKAISKMFPQKS